MPERTASRRAGGWLRPIGDALSSVLFPADCRICENLLLSSSRVPVCDACLQSFARLQGRLCAICGLPSSIWSLGPSAPASVIEPLRCPLCQTRGWSFDRARSFAEYKGNLVRAVILLKFERIDPLGTWFADCLAEVARVEQLEAELVVPVPLHAKRRQERGYNQVDLIAEPLAKKLAVPYGHDALLRIRPRPNKHLLSIEERWQSVRGAFATRAGSQVDNLRVLLVDDVMTTGATLDACASVLREAGAKSVLGLTVARAARHPLPGLFESKLRGTR